MGANSVRHMLGSRSSLTHRYRIIIELSSRPLKRHGTTFRLDTAELQHCVQ
jgi:hypothetical protein